MGDTGATGPINNIIVSSDGGIHLNGVAYDDGVFTVYSNKSFIIPHPTTPSKYLVHACLEGPESGVYYRGESSIKNGEYVEIQLPHYVSKIATNFTVHIMPLCNQFYYTSKVINNAFQVFGGNGSFTWIVYGTRNGIEVEPDIDSVTVKGSGPYKWI